MSNIVPFTFPGRISEAQTNDVAEIISDCGLPDIMRELETKLCLMLGYVTELRDAVNAPIETDIAS